MTDSNPLDELKPRRQRRQRENISADELLKTIEALRGRYVYFTGMDRYHDTCTGTTITKTAIDTAHLLQLSSKAAHTLLASDAIEIMQGPTWLPNGPRIIERGAGRYLNVYEPPTEISIEGDVTLYQDLVQYIIPDTDVREHFLDWQAFVIQCPEQKPNWHPLIGAAQGVGKDALIYPLKRSQGSHNVATVCPQDLTGQFNDQIAKKKLGILNEMLAFRDGGLENQLKQYAASPPEMLTINPKNASRYTIPNVIALVGMTNHRSKGMTVSSGDRRWFAYWSEAEPLDESYYSELWQWLQGDGGLHVWHWLANRDLSGFNARGRAPDSDYKRELIEVSEDPNLAKLRERIEEGLYPFVNDLVSMDRVLGYLDNPKLDAGSAGGLLRELGCKHYRPSRKVDGRTRSVRVWSVRNHEKYSAMRPAELFDLADQLTANTAGGPFG